VRSITQRFSSGVVPERCNSSGQPWTPAVTLPQGCDGLSARRMAVLWTFREPSLCRHVHRELMRKAALNLTIIIPATACHQRNYVVTYNRSKLRSRISLRTSGFRTFAVLAGCRPKILTATPLVCSMTMQARTNRSARRLSRAAIYRLRVFSKTGVRRAP
jgi:hypothetical protein